MARLTREEQARHDRIKRNDALRKEGYIPVPDDDTPCLDGKKHMRGRRCDDELDPDYFRQPVDNSEAIWQKRMRRDELERIARAEEARNEQGYYYRGKWVVRGSKRDVELRRDSELSPLLPVLFD